MILKRDWLWDKKFSPQQAKEILNKPVNRHFVLLAALLLSRNNSPREVFKGYMKPIIFLENWNKIKRQMRKNSWNDPRIEFWQAIYDNLKAKYRKQGIKFTDSHPQVKTIEPVCKSIGDKIKIVRKQKGLTQSDLANRLKVSQQIISRIEQGKENVSILTLKKISDGLNVQLHLDISDAPH